MSLMNTNPVNAQTPKKIALVISNPAISTTTGWPVGFWWSELTHPYYEFTEAGYQVEIFSEAGGPCEADSYSDPRDASGYSAHDLISLGFIHSPTLAALVQNTKKVSEIQIDQCDAIVVAGGQAPMFTYEKAVNLQKKFVEFYEAGKITSALCHGVAILRYTRLSNGEWLARGKTITGFANLEEDFANAAAGTTIMPWRIEDAMKEIGANFVQYGAWKSFAVRDGHLITGQQNFSGAATARLVIEALGR